MDMIAWRLNVKQCPHAFRLERVAENMAGGETGELSAQEESMHKELTNMKDDIASTLDEVAQVSVA